MAVTALAVVVAVSTTGVAPADGDTGPVAGQAGVVSSLQATPSQVTVTGPTGLQVTVNQTQSLDNQTVSVSWSNGPPTFSGSPSQGFSDSFDGDYVQIFQCWSDPLTQAGPNPTQCEFGGENSNPCYYPASTAAGCVGAEFERVLSEPGWSTYGNVGGVVDPATGYDVEPFTPVDGPTVDVSANYNYDLNPLAPQPFWLNPWFSFATTNEIDFARTYADGTGNALFQVDTGLEAPGLGCGQEVADNDTQVPDCWLVVVPRGTPDQENPPGLTGTPSVVTSPLTPEAWTNRVVIPLGFNPVGSQCSIAANPQQIEGDELAASALSSWEPALCGQPGAPVVSYIQNDDDAARQNLTDASYGSVGMSVFSDPIDPDQLSSSTKLDYAPLTLSGVVVAFNIDRVPITDPDGNLDPSELTLSGSRVANIYLTPRLVAKLLTESYESQFRGLRPSDPPSGYSWVVKNPVSIFTDPDFLQYNPEFALLSTSNLIDAGNIIVEEGSSDAAAALWQWVLADPAARAWLDGQPDPWGMRVNPYYSINPAINPNHAAFGSPAVETFPKNDPYCDSYRPLVGTGSDRAEARPICIQDWSPYVQSLQAAALDAASANDGAKTTLNTSNTPDTAWTANGPQLPGQDLIMSVTTTSDADQYGLQVASLSRDGDDGSDPTFITPTTSSLLAGEAAMTKSDVAGVLQPDPTTTASGAYPLTMLTYAVTDPATLSASAKQTYSSLLSYAATDGQSVGPDPGQLPAGYVPLPATLDAQTKAVAADLVAQPAKTATQPPTPAVTTPTTTTPTSVPEDDVGTSTEEPLNENESTGPPPPVTAPPTKSPHARTLPPSQLAAVRSPYISVGVVRWTLPGVLVLGLAAAATAVLMGFLRRRPRAAAGPGEAAIEPDPDGPGS